MIETKLLQENPPIVYHRISGKMSSGEAAKGAAAAMSLIKSVVAKHETFDLILDMRGYLCNDLNAHKIWSLQFKEQKFLENSAQRVAIIGDDTEKLKTEKKLMETVSLKFFTQIKQAVVWFKR